MRQEKIKDLNHDNDGHPQITILKRHQTNGLNYYARFLVPQAKRHLNDDNT